MIRALVAEDSAVAREHLVELLDGDPALEVVGQARNGVEAVEQAEKLRPDVVVMDIEMPRMDGYEATRRIMESFPTPIVMVSAHASHLETRGFEALRAGALVLLNKPAGAGHPDHSATARELVSNVKLMAEVKVVRHWPRRTPPAAPPPPTRSRDVCVVAIGASAGGPPVVAEVLAGLPARIRCPIMLVQHTATGFAGGLAEWLDRSTPLTVRLARPNEHARPGTAYVAPDGLQMGIAKSGRITLTADDAFDGFRPSASHLLRSVARSFGPAAIGVLLTGMGRDGASGLLDLRRAGGLTIAQDEESCTVFGMPKEAIRLGAAEHVLPPGRIAETIRSLTMPFEARAGKEER